MKVFIFTALAIVLVLTLSGFAATAFDKTTGSPVVIDVRTEEEWSSGHLEGAILIPYDTITDGIIKRSVGKKEQIYLYCRSGRRSGLALDSLRKSGYDHVINLGTVENASKTLKRKIVK